MAYSALKDTQRMASHYAADLEEDVESWKRDHNGALKCRDLDERLTVFNALIRASLRIETRRRGAILPGEFQPDQEIERHTAGVLQSLSKSCSKINEIIEWYENQDDRIEAATEFRTIWMAINQRHGANDGS